MKLILQSHLDRRRAGVGGNEAEQGVGKRGSGGDVGGGLRLGFLVNAD
jgi:hypothetical protein